MLLTMRHEAQRQHTLMPYPHRLQLVRRSMGRIKRVLDERAKALEQVRPRVAMPLLRADGAASRRYGPV